MIYVGIDIAKNKHACCLVDSLGTILLNNFQFKNSKQGFESLLMEIKNYQEQLNDSDIKIGMEATGHYNDNLLYFLQSHSYNVTIFNPLATNLYRKSMTLRKTKTDKIDALVIAKMLLSNYEGNQTENNDRIKDLKACTRFRQRLNEKITKEKIHFSRLIEIVFPELSESVWSTNQKSVYELLKQYPNVIDLSRAHLTTLTNCLLKGSNGKYGQEKAIEIRNKAKNSIGKVSKYLDIELLSILKRSSISKMR
ncbi:IS110 family transposase [Enterococcus faecalis]|uniref:IS110 family transposase n=1 Tax=Enterococcus faecalis TaxID=1351 RepID=UPI00191C332E|nr:transposase [Enterococcus faecalis]